jgi:glycosyltransferase involved in cell wall biosynthesis
MVAPLAKGPPLPLRSRIVVLVHGLEMGGAERQALLLIQALRTRWESHVELWSLQSGIAAKTKALETGVPVRVLGFGTPPGAFKVVHMAGGLARRLRRARPDYLVPFLDLPNLLANLAWRFTRVRGCIWNQRSTAHFSRRTGLERIALRLAGSVVANSETVLRAMEARFGRMHQPAFVVHNGVEVPVSGATRQEWRGRLGITDSAFVGCMVANLTAYKDHETLVRAWRLVTDGAATRGSVEPPILVLAGRHNGTAASVQELARQSGIEPALRLPGHVDDVGGLLAAADLGVLSSVSEGCPNAVLEYMAAGLPVVATDLPAVREIISARNVELLVPPRAPGPLAAAILSVMFDLPAAAEIGKENRVSAVTRFSVETMAERMAEAIAASGRRLWRRASVERFRGGHTCR